MDDLITRLKEATEDWVDCGPHCDLHKEAIEEIERLRRIADLIHNDFRKEAWEEAHAYFTEST